MTEFVVWKIVGLTSHVDLSCRMRRLSSYVYVAMWREQWSKCSMTSTDLWVKCMYFSGVKSNVFVCMSIDF